MTEAQTYLQQIRERVATLAHCLSGAPADRFHERPGPHLNPMRSNAKRIRHTISHAYAHVGEIRYAKGVLGLPDSEHLQPAR